MTWAVKSLAYLSSKAQHFFFYKFIVLTNRELIDKHQMCLPSTPCFFLAKHIEQSIIFSL